MGNLFHSFGTIVISVVGLFVSGHKSLPISVPTIAPMLNPVAKPKNVQNLPNTQNIQNVQGAQKTVVTGNGSISIYGETLNIHIAFPKSGGKVIGTLGNACSGDIAGTYSGGNTGNLDAKANANCPVVFTNIQGMATFTGKADLSKGLLNGDYSASAAGTTKTGKLTLTLSE